MHNLELVPLSDRDFKGFRDIIYREAGIHISEHKRELLTARLSRRIRSLGMKHFGEYLSAVEREAPERVEMLDRVVTNETRFYREPKQFELLETTISPRWREEAERGARTKRVRVWSAGCSTGQEPYSLAMSLLANLEGWSVEILASDISGRALRQAMAGLWPVEKATEIPERYLQSFMLRGVRTQSGKMLADDRVRDAIRFQRINLHDELPEVGMFDLVFCRNVLIYFDVASRTQAVKRLLSRLVPAGYLFLGHSESLLSSGLRLRPVAPSVYTRGGGT
jgi:chemotaxis protein methyltransferase CheR